MSAESQRSPEATQDDNTGRGSLLSQLRKFENPTPQDRDHSDVC